MLFLLVALVLMSVLAMGFVVWPLLRAKPEPVFDRSDVNIELYREHKAELENNLAIGRIDTKEYEVLLRELDLSLLAEEAGSSSEPLATTDSRSGRLLLLSMLPVLIVFSAYWYLQYGAAQDVEISQLATEKYMLEIAAVRGDASQRESALKQLADIPMKLQNKLQARLTSDPENTQYWYLSARTFMELGQYQEAQDAYQQILQREADHTQIKAELAQARFLAAGNQIDPIIDTLVEQVLAVDAVNPTALGLAGISAFESKSYEQAIDFWRRAVDVMGAQAPGSQALEAGIVRAQQLLGEAVAPSEGVPAKAPPAAGPSLRINVSVASSVSARPDQVVFVYARAWQGGKMPLAIAKLTVSDLPKVVLLDESMAMAAGMGLSSAEQLQLVARISESGGVVPSPGDWQAQFGPVDLAADNNDLRLVISEPVL